MLLYANLDRRQKLELFAAQRAKEEGGVRNFPIPFEHDIKLVPVQLSKDFFRSKAHKGHGHYNTREEFELIMKEREGNITITKVFEHAKEMAMKHSSRQGNPEAKEKFVMQHGNTVVLVGQAGIGKTTLCRILVQLILEKKLLPECKYVFFLQFRKVDFESKLTYPQLILPGSDLASGDTPISDESIMQILGQGEEVVLIHDALDEANTKSFSNMHPLPSDTKLATADVHFKRLLLARLLPKAIKVFTSRPKQFMEMPSELRPLCVVDVLGLNKKSQEELCRQICQSEDVCCQVLKYLEDNPDIAASCYVAAKCILIMYILSKRIEEHNKVDVESLTDIFIQVLAPYASSDHLRGKEKDLIQLAAFALKGFLESKIAFSEKDIKHSGISDEAFEAFLVTFTDSKYKVQLKILEGHKESYFSHLIWQELFTAIHIVFFMPLEEVEQQIVHFQESRWEVVAKFVYGLFNPKVYAEALRIFGVEDDLSAEPKMQRLTDFVVNRMRDVHPTDTLELLTLCSWLRELNNSKVNNQALSHLPSSLELTEKILPTDLPSLIYGLRSASKPIILRVDSKQGK